MTYDRSRMDKRVAIKQRSSYQDAAGQPIETWSHVITDTSDNNVWADIRHLSGLETVKGGADTSIIKASIRIGYRAGIDAGMRIEHGSMIYNIQAAIPVGRNEYLDLPCEVVQ